MEIGNRTLTPAFDSALRNYTATLPAPQGIEIRSFGLTATPSVQGATVTYEVIQSKQILSLLNTDGWYLQVNLNASVGDKASLLVTVQGGGAIARYYVFITMV